MRILVIGASRGIGRACVAAGQGAGHTMRALARSAGDMAPEPGLEPWPGDATDATDLEPALADCDAVLMTLGIRESVSMLWKPVTLFSRATEALVPLMERQGPRRLVCVTGIGAGNSVSALSTPERALQRLVLGEPYKDKTRQEDIIRASSLDWTLLRPTILTNGRRSGAYRVLREPRLWRMGLISRADVADCAIRALDDPAMIGADPVVTR
ncbi:SDR family oxidoreductase [Thalassococcus sp. CAU 1522]|uniref:SDR family oxidoreductase n=1 Tax=Thalassococcus arenae TaxID=2851652 RepID=A0ABS6N3J4_9RHOB|nr:NAD(P)-binding oxidoreductase [Thalassococcus arenae]MBV2358581.1 SDR family oxidoreductase [Thalassococcus arenae]